MTAETITPNHDTNAPRDIESQLDHIDIMLHEIKQLLDQLEPLVPLIPRALALLDPGSAVRRHLPGGKHGR